MQFADFRSHLNTKFRVEVGERFVHKEYFGVFYSCSAERNSLSLTSRKVLRLSVSVFFEPKNVYRPFGLFLYLVFRHFHVLQTVRNILFNGHVRIKRVVLEYHGYSSVAGENIVHFLSVYEQFAACYVFKARYHAQRRRFSAAGRTYERDKFFFVYFKVEIRDRIFFCAGVFFAQSFKLNVTHFFNPPWNLLKRRLQRYVSRRTHRLLLRELLSG